MTERSPSILLVEDNEDDAYFIKRAFQSLGLKAPVRHIQDRQEAIEYLEMQMPKTGRSEERSPLLVILDLKIRGKSGFDILEWIRTHEHPSLTVVILTGSSEKKDIEKADQFQVDAYRIKPSSLQDMKEVARTICHLWLNHMSNEDRRNLFQDNMEGSRLD